MDSENEEFDDDVSFDASDDSSSSAIDHDHDSNVTCGGDSDESDSDEHEPQILGIANLSNYHNQVCIFNVNSIYFLYGNFISDELEAPRKRSRVQLVTTKSSMEINSEFVEETNHLVV